MKLGSIVGAMEALNNLSNEKVPVSTAFKLKKIIRSIEGDLKSYDDLRKGLFEKFGEKKEDSYEIPKERLDDFYKELNDLLSTEVKTEITKLKLSDLGDLKIETKMLFSLDEFIEE